MVKTRTRLSSRLKKVAWQLLSACSEACETGNEKGVGVAGDVSAVIVIGFKAQVHNTHCVLANHPPWMAQTATDH